MRFATNKIFTLFFCCLVLSVSSQQNLSTYTKNEGLTSSNVLFTYVDSKGIIWAATNFGVNAFYANKWNAIKYIKGKDGQNKYLGKVLEIFEAKNSDLWIATNRGVFYYNRKYWTYYSDVENSDFSITNIFEDVNSNIWFFLEKQASKEDVGKLGFTILDGRVQIFGGNQWITFSGVIGGSAAVPVGAPTKYFTSNIIDSENNIWITSLDGLYLYNGKRWSEYNEEQLSSDKCFKVFESNDKNIWVGCANGLALKKGENWKKYEQTKGIKGNIVYDFFNDSRGRMWAFSSKDNSFNSLLLLNNSKWKSFTNKDLKLKSNVKGIFEISHKVFIYSSKGISVYENLSWKNISKLYDINIDDITYLNSEFEDHIFFTDKSKLYKLSDEGLEVIYEYEGKWQPNLIFKDSKSRLWLGTDRDGLFLYENDKLKYRYTAENGLTDNHINSVFEDSNNNVWIVCRNCISKIDQ